MSIWKAFDVHLASILSPPSLLLLLTLQRPEAVDWFEDLFTSLEVNYDEVGALSSV